MNYNKFLNFNQFNQSFFAKFKRCCTNIDRSITGISKKYARNLDSLDTNIANQYVSVTEAVSTYRRKKCKHTISSEEGHKVVTGTAEIVRSVTENSEG